ncbi:TVP38/TMEM64 family protein, partial [Halomonas sp. MES3-P3E]
MATKLSVKQKLFLGLSLLMGLASLYWILME